MTLENFLTAFRRNKKIVVYDGLRCEVFNGLIYELSSKYTLSCDVDYIEHVNGVLNIILQQY